MLQLNYRLFGGKVRKRKNQDVDLFYHESQVSGQ